MHRSITLSMISSTFSDTNNDRNDGHNKEKFLAKLGIGLIEFLISSSFLCYGIIFAENVYEGKYTVKEGLWTLILYSSCKHIAAPPSKLFTEYVGGRLSNGFRYIIGASACLLCVGVVLPGYILFYGIFGGVFSNVITNQLKYFAVKKCRSEGKSFEGNIQAARAITLLITPHLIWFFVKSFSMDRVSLIFAAFLSSAIPAAWILRPPSTIEEIFLPEMSRYQTLPAFSRQVSEMVNFSQSTNLLEVNNPDSGFIDANDDEGEINGGNEVGEKHEEEEKEKEPVISLKVDILNLPNEVDEIMEHPVVPLTHETVQMYYSNAGVTILPEIPEESDDTQSPNKDFIDPKRLSRISTILEGINQQESDEKEEPTEILSIDDLLRRVEDRDKIQNIEYIPNYNNERKSFLSDIEAVRKIGRCSCFTSYNWKIRLLKLKYHCREYVCMPLFNSFTEPLFYPIVTSKVLVTLTSTIFISIAPYFSRHKIDNLKREETTLLLSYMAFAWSLFLMFLPLVSNFQKRKLRWIFILGLTLFGSSIILLHRKRMSNVFMVASCLLFGCGYGMIKYTENMVYESFLNERKIKIIEGCLELFTGFFVILLYYLIYQFQLDVTTHFPICAGSSNLVIAVIWVLVPYVQTTVVRLRQYYHQREVDESFI